MAKTLFEQKKDYIDTFWPFVLEILPEDQSPLAIDSIQMRVKDKFGLEIPEHSLKSLITRARKKGYLLEVKGLTKLTEEGTKYLDRLESESDVNRRINELLEDIKIFLNDPNLSSDEIKNLVLDFIYENTYLLIQFFNPGANFKLSTPKTNIFKYEDKIVQYFEIAEKQKPSLYNTLRDIVYGSVISAVASSPNISEIDKKFKNFQVFLDTNIIFSMMDLHFPEFNKPAKELLTLLRLNNVALKVFDFTRDEIVYVLRNYVNEQHMYVPGIRVNSIYSKLKNLGWTTEDVRDFIQKIEEKLWSIGITIEPTGIRIKDYKPKEEHLMEAIFKYKPDQTTRGRSHDIAAIEKVKEIRGGPVREIERSKAIFLTSDLKLSNFNYIEMGHKENMTVCEVIPDRLLTNILWLKNPTAVKDLPLTSIIAIHSREMFVNRNIWKRFYENVRKLKESGAINDKDLSMLFYRNYIEEVLSEFDEADFDKITPEFILEEVANASKSIDSETQKKLEQQKIIFDERIAQKESELDKKFAKKMEEIKTALEESSRNNAAKCVNFLKFGLLAILILIGGFISFFSKWTLFYKIIVGLISPVIGILQFLGLHLNVRNCEQRLKVRIFNRIYKKKIEEARLERYLNKNIT